MKARVFGVQILLLPELSENFSLVGRAPIRDHVKFRHKALELLLPVVERGRWRDDQKWTPNSVVFSDVAHESNGLDCFTETLKL